MTPEQGSIERAYLAVTEDITNMYLRFMNEAVEKPKEYEGIVAEDAYIWFIEGLQH